MVTVPRIYKEVYVDAALRSLPRRKMPHISTTRAARELALISSSDRSFSLQMVIVNDFIRFFAQCKNFSNTGNPGHNLACIHPSPWSSLVTL